MSWQTYLTLVVATPLALAGLAAYTGHPLVSKVIYRTEVGLFQPFVTAGICGYLGYLLAKVMVRHAKGRPNGPSADCVQVSIMVQIPLLCAIAGGILGVVIDFGLLIKWIFWK
jgi:hypothetical protein